MMPPRTPTFLDPPARDDALISALSRQPEHTFSQSTQSMTSMLPCQPATHTSTLPRPPAVPMHEAPTSTLPRPPAAPMHNILTSALLTDSAYTHTPPHSQSHTFARPLELAGTHSTVTSALPRPPAAPGDLPTADYTMQRSTDRIDSCKIYTQR